MTKQNRTGNSWQQARDNTLRRVAELGLTGLDRPYYACVLRKVNHAKNPVWKGDIQLDGYCNKLRVAVRKMPQDNANGEKQDCFECRLHGFKPPLEKGDFYLKWNTDKTSGRKKISGHIDLFAARLIVTIVSTTNDCEEPISLCLPEVRRGAQNSGDNQSSPSSDG